MCEPEGTLTIACGPVRQRQALQIVGVVLAPLARRAQPHDPLKRIRLDNPGLRHRIGRCALAVTGVGPGPGALQISCRLPIPRLDRPVQQGLRFLAHSPARREFPQMEQNLPVVAV